MSKFSTFLTVLSSFLLFSSPSARAVENFLPDSFLDTGPVPGHILVVDKKEQALYLYRHDGQGNVFLDRVMPCSTGENQGDKMLRGDKKTPNGFYLFNQKFLPQELSEIYGILAYPMDYPNFWDRRLGRGGDGIWTHGINKPLTDFDSNGCVEVRNIDLAPMEELIRLQDTPIVVYEELTRQPVERLRAESLAVHGFLESWRQAWQNKEHQAYRDKYALDFVNSDGRSYEAWMTNKEAVALGYPDIRVELRNIRIFRHREVIVALFEQYYRGGAHFSSQGLKRLYLSEEDNIYKIVAEEFRPLPGPQPDKWLTAEQKQWALETPPPVALAALDGETDIPADASEADRREIEALIQAYETARRAVDETGQALTQAEADLASLEPAAADWPALTEIQTEAADQAEAELAMLTETEAAARALVRDRLEVQAAAAGEVAALSAALARSEAQIRSLSETLERTRAEASGLGQSLSAAEEASLAADQALASAQDEAEKLGRALGDIQGDLRDRQAALAEIQAQATSLDRRRAEVEERVKDAGQALSQAEAQAQEKLEDLRTAQERLKAETSARTLAQAEAREAEVRALTQAEARSKARDMERITALVNDWAAAWASRDTGAYFSFYHPEFYFQDRRLDLSGFKQYKTPLIRNAGRIEVKISELSVKLDDSLPRAVFLQEYSSDNTNDVGYKTLVFKKRNEEWKIVEESWTAR